MSQAKTTLLPFEVLSLIVNHVSPDTPSLASLALVSHDWNTVTTPLLYRQFRQRETWRARNPVYLFTHTILARPDLASHVRHLSLGRLYSKERQRFEVHDDFLALCRNSMDRVFATWLDTVMEDEQRQGWIDQLNKRLPETLQCILLCCLPSLETLFLEEDREIIYIWELFEVASRLIPSNRPLGQSIPQELPFSKIHSIRRIGDGLNASKSLSYCLGYFKLPNILKLEFSSLYSLRNPPIRTIHDRSSSQGSSPVQHLSFQHSYLAPHPITAVIKTCANLKDFRYSMSCKCPRNMTPQNIVQPLTRHAKTLETLQISLYTSEEPSYYGELPSFLDLTNLKHLTLGYWDMIVPDSINPGHPTYLSDVLPPSLESLELPHHSSKLLPHIQALDSAKRKGNLPNLRRLRCTFKPNTVHPSEFESLGVSGVEAQFAIEVTDRCNFSVKCKDPGEGTEDSVAGNPLEDRSNLFDDDFMLALNVPEPDSESNQI